MLKCYQRSETNFLAISVVTTSGYLLLKGQTEPITCAHSYKKKKSRYQLKLQDCTEQHTWNTCKIKVVRKDDPKGQDTKLRFGD